MRQGLTVASAILIGALALAGCGKKGEERPTREAVTASLQQEADSLKSDGEKLDPVLRVKATWTVEGLDVTERANDPDRPWAGTIRFKIRGETRDTGGAVIVDEFERRFDYVYATSVSKWIFQLAPSPAP
jgi:hypothetical protein